ncbi:hypothetical protein LSM04_007451 [Trypanosoma melophagium]|uniref:uncharacterized protein n=1 Tax=Trypanosoma melophagium TaxID=715481 RepID=UPI00351A891B|nr:hypothetical protein LSM04_007451 [Trypanosoma melophagium]
MPYGGDGGDHGDADARRVFMEVEIDGGEVRRYLKVEPRARFRNVTRAIGREGVLLWNGAPLAPQETPLSLGMPRGVENAFRVVFLAAPRGGLGVRDWPPPQAEEFNERDWLEALAIHRRRMEELRLQRSRFPRGAPPTSGFL